MMTRFMFCVLCLCAVMICSASLYAQEFGKPKKITSIPGGYFVEWDSPIEIAGVKLDKSLSGTFEMMFDVPSVEYINNVLDRRTPSTSNPEMVTALADYWITRGKPERAIPLYEKALEQGNLEEKRALLFQNNLAMLLSKAGQHEKALEIVKNALESKKDDFSLLNTKGLILMNSGKPDEAVSPLTQAVEFSCQIPLYCMHLAMALHQSGRDNLAQSWFDKARPPLLESVPKMGKENKAMFDALQTAYPPAQ